MKLTTGRQFRWPILLGLLLAAVGLGPVRTAALDVRGVETKRNNLVTELLDAKAVAEPTAEFTFTRAADGWVFIAAAFKGTGTSTITLDPASQPHTVVARDAKDGPRVETMRHVARGEHRLRVECTGNLRIAQLVVTAIPELIHCGLGFDPAIKSYGRYDLEFLKNDILPNVTTLIVPHNIALPRPVIDDWHRQGKRFVAEVGVGARGQTAEDHFKYWTGFLDKSPFLDGIIVNEFIVNNPSSPAGVAVSPERQGSGKKLNQEMVGPTFFRTLIDTNCRIALERYLHEMSSEKGSKDALETFVDGIADWEAKEPGVKKQMVIAFGLFSMPPGGLNKLPNVDYHVWMDQQMNVVANHPQLAGIGGLEWWTSLQADEETVRFVGKLYRHYAIEGRTDRMTRDPLFTTHLRNADFANELNGWTVGPAEAGTIMARSFPRYGRIEGRFMGLGRPADPEHIGDTFLWMKRSAKGPNTFSQTIKNLEPGRLYSMKMFSCDYQDLVNPKSKSPDEATPFLGKVVLEGVEVDPKRSFTEMYASNPEPRIPVWITYHWKVFRATATTAKVIVSDWPNEKGTTGTFGQEQTFNFLEIQPYHP